MGVVIIIIIATIFITVKVVFTNTAYSESIKNEENTSLQKMQQLLDSLAKLPKDSISGKGKYLILDTETTGLPHRRNALPEDFKNWPYIVEIAWFLIDEDGLMVDGCHYIIKQNISIPESATKIHHITTQDMLSKGESPQEVYNSFVESAKQAEWVIAHNLEFDLPIIDCELLRNGFEKILFSKKKFCTMEAGRKFCMVFDRAGKIKKPKLSKLFGQLYFDNPHLTFEGTHNALADTNMLYRCFMKMKQLHPNILDEVTIQEYEPKSFRYQQQEKTLVIGGSIDIPMIQDKELFLYFGKDGFRQSQVLVTGVAKEEKDDCWNMITQLNGKVVKSVTKNLAIVVLGPIPGWKKVADIKAKIQSGERIIGITDVQLQILYERLK